MKHRLPSLKALVAAEAVGRHGSITHAAAELHVTPGAVSRHVALLEEHFGCRLFVRHSNGLALTEIGRIYVDRLKEAFGLIDRASSDILRASERKTLVIRALGSFTTEWLLPRIARFENEHPDIAVSIRGRLAGVDFGTDDADVGILASADKPADVGSLKLYTPLVTPIVSPDLLRQKPPLRGVADLRHFTLLHAMHLLPTWEQWVSTVGPDHSIDTTQGHWLERASQVTQAVRHGVGVGLGQWLLIGDELVRGSLVAPLQVLVPSPLSVYLVWRKRGPLRPEIASFRDWLVSALATAESALPQLRRVAPEA